MEMPLRKAIACIALALVSAAVLSACGGGGGGDSTGSTAPSDTPAAAAGPGGEESASSPSPSSSGKDSTGAEPQPARERAAYERERYGKPSALSAPFARYSGKGKTKLHLAEFGAEASGGERAEIEVVVEDYLAAIEARRWDEACAQLWAAAQQELVSLLPKTLQDGGCGAALRVFVESFEGAGGKTRVLGADGIVSLRVEQGSGFALFHAGDGGDYWLAVKDGDEGWAPLSLVPQPFAE